MLLAPVLLLLCLHNPRSREQSPWSKLPGDFIFSLLPPIRHENRGSQSLSITHREQNPPLSHQLPRPCSVESLTLRVIARTVAPSTRATHKYKRLDTNGSRRLRLSRSEAAVLEKVNV